MDANLSSSSKWIVNLLFGGLIVTALCLIVQHADMIVHSAQYAREAALVQERIVIPVPGRPGDVYFRGVNRDFIAATSKLSPACYADPSLLDNEKLPLTATALANVLRMDAREIQNIILAKRDTTYRWIKSDITPEQLEAIGDLNLPRDIPDDQLDDASQKVAAILAVDAERVRQAFRERRGSKFVWIKKDLDEVEVEAINALRKNKNYRGIGIEWQWHRDYPNGNLASATLGYQLKSGEAGEGIEAVLHKYIAPKAGVRENLGDSGRRQLSALRDVPPVDGSNVYLTIDPVIQDILEKAANRAKDKHKAAWVAGVVMDPHSGRILAMYGTPGFDPNKFNEVDNPEQRQNRPLVSPYEPGSSFKPIIAAAFVDAGLISWNTTIDCGGGTFYPPNGGKVGDHGNAYGVLSMSDVIIRSSNIGMSKLGLMMGKTRVHEVVKRFGFGSRVPIQLPDGRAWPGQSAGIVRRLSDWDGFSLPRVPFGQEVAVTSLQLTNAFCALANGGELLQPRLVDCIVAPDGSVTWQSERKVIRRVISEQTSRSTLAVMASVVEKEYGTGHATTQMDRWTSFGKTGTAQVARGGQLATGVYTGSFVGGAPASHPRVVCLISVHHPRTGGYYGGTVAGPVFKDVVEKTLAYLNVSPDRTEPVIRRAWVRNRD
ncbi:MAG: penicillin-binding protein 2 [Phycisphaerae bacterium]|nr:penicillin-binding protein 2 [Phycisphaerae bacterium]